ncbi:hypothetical protein [Nocardioides phosphati]|nr:hypothetical protein [Nocardioides phosphati]
MRRLLALAPLLLVAACGGPDVHAGKPVAATSEALVAVALSHLTPNPDEIEYRRAGEPIDDMGTTDPSLGGVLRWKPDPDFVMDVQVQPTPKGFTACSEIYTCAKLGKAELAWQDGGEDAPPYLKVFVVRDGELRSVGYEGGMTGDPRTSLLPFDLRELEQIVTDPAFSMTTTEGAVEAGKELAHDGVKGSRVRPMRLAEPAPPPRTTPRSLAAAVQAHLVQAGEPHLVRSGRAGVFAEPGGTPEPAVGVTLALRHGLTMHVTVIDADDEDVDRCQPTLACWPWDGVLHAGREGLGGSFAHHDGYSVHAWLEGAGVHATRNAWFLSAERGHHAQWIQLDVAGLASLDGEDQDGPEGVSPRTTPELVRAGEKLTWFHD